MMKKITILLILIVFTTFNVWSQTHDLMFNEIKPQTIYYGDSARIYPVINIVNSGTETETSFDVHVVINDGVSNVYDYTQNITGISFIASSDTNITMNEIWAITDPSLTYSIDATVILTDDEDSANDFVTGLPTITELTYTKQAYAMRYVSGSTNDPFVSIDSESGDLEILIDNIDYYAKTGAEFVYGVLYGLDNTSNAEPYLFIMQENGVEIILGNVTGYAPGYSLKGISYDADNDIMYVVASTGDISKLYTLNIQTLELTEVGTINETTDTNFFDIEYANGKLYAIEMPDNSRLWEIDPLTAIGTPKSQFLTMAYSSLDHCLTYDPVTEIMYATLFHWASGSDYRGYLVSVNLGNGAATVIQEYGIDHNIRFFATQATAPKNIISFEIPGQVDESIIDNNNYTVTLDMPSGTDITSLIPSIEVSNNATILPLSGTPQDFSTTVEYIVTGRFGKEQIWNVTVNILTNIIDIEKTEISIYPNPSNNNLTITGMDISNIRITDVTGKLVRQLTTTKEQITINISDLENGIYYVKVGNKTRKFIKQ